MWRLTDFCVLDSASFHLLACTIRGVMKCVSVKGASQFSVHRVSKQFCNRIRKIIGLLGCFALGVCTAENRHNNCEVCKFVDMRDSSDTQSTVFILIVKCLFVVKVFCVMFLSRRGPVRSGVHSLCTKENIVCVDAAYMA